jgi:Domain of unknown function (DUF4259)
MGTWDTGSFENDDAMDWVAELEIDGLGAVDAAFDALFDALENYLDAGLCANALAAAEVVAALRGRPAADFPVEVEDWLAAHPGAPGDELAAAARRAVDLVLGDSELAELWSESPEAPAWRAGVEELRARLG